MVILVKRHGESCFQHIADHRYAERSTHANRHCNNRTKTIGTEITHIGCRVSRPIPALQVMLVISDLKIMHHCWRGLDTWLRYCKLNRVCAVYTVHDNACGRGELLRRNIHYMFERCENTTLACLITDRVEGQIYHALVLWEYRLKMEFQSTADSLSSDGDSSFEDD